MHTGYLPPTILALRNSFFEPPQFLRHYMESVNFSLERRVIEATDHSIGLFLAFRPQLERLKLLSSVYRLPVVVEDGRGVQRLGVNLVAVIPQPYDNGVRVEYDLYILRLPNVAVRASDGEGDEVIPAVGFKPQRDFVSFDAVASLVQRETSSGGRVWGLVGVVRIFERPYEEVLSWVKVSFAPVTSGAAPQSARHWCTDWRSASRAAILALLLAAALANCSSLHVEQTFRSAICDAFWFVKGDR